MTPESLTSITHMAKAEGSAQTELRAKYTERLTNLKTPITEAIKDYREALKDGLFEDQAGEEEESGEKRKIALQTKINTLVERAEKLKAQLDSPEPLPAITLDLTTTYSHPDGHQETIHLDLEQKLQDFTTFYQQNNIDLPSNFEDIIHDLWERNQTEIQTAIEQNGFDDLLLIPANLSLPDLADKLKMENGIYEYSNFTDGGSFTQAQDQHPNQDRIVLVHHTQNLADRPELASTLNTLGQDVKLDQALTLTDYLIFQKKYFEETNQHLDVNGWTWLATKSGARLVGALWNPDVGRLLVHAYALSSSDPSLGVRPSRSFFWSSSL